MDKTIPSTDDRTVRVGVAALIESDDKILLLRRFGSHGSGRWALPGGHQEFGESPEQTAVREANEETGMTVTAIERLGYTDDQMLDEEKHYITLYIRCAWLAGEPNVMEPDKATDVAWFTMAQLRERDADLFAPLRTFLNEKPELMTGSRS